MELNITVFVQIVHFIIAYLLLERLFFRPAFFCIEGRDHQSKKLQDTLSDQIKQVAIANQQAEQSRLLCQRKLVQATPPPVPQGVNIKCTKIEATRESSDLLEKGQRIGARLFSANQEQEVIDRCTQQLLGKIL